MGEFFRDAGWGIYPVMLFGALGFLAALAHAALPRRDRFALAVGLAVATVLAGCLGAVVGVQTSAAGYSLAGTPPLHLFLVGLRESLNNMVAALVFATVQTLIATCGAARQARNENVGAARAAAA
ncbi:MAG: hypothetical protein IPG50_13170 [Myxococcales bacterium]|nr:hypothetical protein [Myxococcales bacterium]